MCKLCFLINANALFYFIYNVKASILDILYPSKIYINSIFGISIIIVSHLTKYINSSLRNSPIFIYYPVIGNPSSLCIL